MLCEPLCVCVLVWCCPAQGPGTGSWAVIMRIWHLQGELPVIGGFLCVCPTHRRISLPSLYLAVMTLSDSSLPSLWLLYKDTNSWCPACLFMDKWSDGWMVSSQVNRQTNSTPVLLWRMTRLPRFAPCILADLVIRSSTKEVSSLPASVDPSAC